MTNKVSNFSDLIQRVTASCLLHPLGSTRHYPDDDSEYDGTSYKTDPYHDDESRQEEEEEEEELDEEQQGGGDTATGARPPPYFDDGKKVKEMELLLIEVFDTVSSMKKAYVSLQEAHSPWDPDKIRLADVSVVAELRRLAALRERFHRRRRGSVSSGERRIVGPTLREVVTPYEAAIEKLKREVKNREAEIENLRDKLKSSAVLSGNGGGSISSGRKGRSSHSSNQPRRKAGAVVPVAPMPDLFETCMDSVKEASKSFTSVLLSLMKSAHWDIAAAVRSIEAAAATSTTSGGEASNNIVGPNHAKYALESYVNRKIFQGFDHETFYMDGSLSSLLNPDQFRTECFTQYRDMKAMDPIELLGILPDCHFGKFCSKKYLSIVHPKMEESLFGDLEQRRRVLAGNHPRSRFYGEFLGLAKAVWLLHLLAFSLDPPPSHFEGSKGADFHPEYMESVVRFPGGRVGAGQVVGFPVSPGFKLGNGSVVKARVYLVPKF